MLQQRKRCGVGIGQDLAVILWKIADASFVAPARLPGVSGQLAHQNLQERGFAETVGTYNRHAFVPAQHQRDIRQHALRSVGLVDVLDKKHVLAARPLGHETQHRLSA